VTQVDYSFVHMPCFFAFAINFVMQCGQLWCHTTIKQVNSEVFIPVSVNTKSLKLAQETPDLQSKTK